MFAKVIVAIKLLLCVAALVALYFVFQFARGWLSDLDFSRFFGGTMVQEVIDTANTEGEDDMVIGTDRRISASQAHALMERYPQAIVLDVRSETEFAQERIRGARLLPGDEIYYRAHYELPDYNALILVYCRSGVRSQAAVQLLVSMGYTQVYDFGGIISWPYARE